MNDKKGYELIIRGGAYGNRRRNIWERRKVEID